MIFVSSPIFTICITVNNLSPPATSGEGAIRRLGSLEQRLVLDVGRAASLLQGFRDIHPSECIPGCKRRAVRPERAWVLWAGACGLSELFLQSVAAVGADVRRTGVPRFARSCERRPARCRRGTQLLECREQHPVCSCVPPSVLYDDLTENTFKVFCGLRIFHSLR